MDGFAVARWAAFTATLVILGAAGLGRLLAGARDLPVDVARRTRQRAGTVVAIAGVVLLLAAWARLNGQARTFLEPEEPVTREMLALVLSTSWGLGWKLQAATAGVITGLALALRRAVVHPLFVVPLLVLAAVTPLTGHAAGGDLGLARALPAHALHLAGLGAWLGTLALLALALLPASRSLPPIDRAGVVAPLVRNFAPLGLVGAGVAVATGGFLGWNYTGPLTGLWADPYGRTLLLKLGVVGVIAVLGAVNWRVLAPRSESGDLGPLRSSMWIELLLGLAAVGITAVLVAEAAPGV